jgi:hypothetical protein
VSHPYKTIGRIIVLYILIFIFLDSKLEDSALKDSKHSYGEWITDTYHSNLQDLGMSMEELVVPVHQRGAVATICEPHHLSLRTVECNHCMLLIEDQLHKIITGGSAL